MKTSVARCPSCSAEVAANSRFCPVCGQALTSLSEMSTVAGAAVSPAASRQVGRMISSDSIPVWGFTPGTVLAERYCIIGRLGRRGMGEVYRVDDLTLGQSVALKFLPRAV